MDSKLLSDSLTPEKIKKLWDGDFDNTIPSAERVDPILAPAPLATLVWLSIRGVLLACIKDVLNISLCTSRAFAQAHRRNWRGKGKTPDGIHKKTDTNPGDGTSCDHLVSQHAGLIPQSICILTYARFWGSVIYVDNFSDFIYSRLIKGTTSADTLES